MLSFLSGWRKHALPRPDEQEAAGALFSSLLLMAWFVEARDPYTGGHLWRVSRYSRLLAEAAGLEAVDVARVSLGGFLHDLGKIGITDAVLRKTSALDEQEHALIRSHPYRAGMSRGQALAIIQSQSGSQFDPALCEHFLMLGRQGVLDHVIAHSDEGIPLQHCPMCGPTLVVRREQQVGEAIFCRNCGGGFILEQGKAGLLAKPTGEVGDPRARQPEADHGLIRRVIAEAIASMPLQQMLNPTVPLPAGTAP